jgi:hypothetical protein
MAKKLPAPRGDKSQSEWIIRNSSEGLRNSKELAAFVKNGRPITPAEVQSLEDAFTLWRSIERRLLGKSLTSDARVVGEFAADILSRDLPTLFYAIAKRLGVNAHCKPGIAPADGNEDSPEWLQVWHAMKGAALAAASPEAPEKRRGPKPDPIAEDIVAEYSAGNRDYYSIIENLQLKTKWQGRLPYARVKNAVAAHKKRLKQKKSV